MRPRGVVPYESTLCMDYTQTHTITQLALATPRPARVRPPTGHQPIEIRMTRTIRLGEAVTDRQQCCNSSCRSLSQNRLGAAPPSQVHVDEVLDCGGTSASGRGRGRHHRRRREQVNSGMLPCRRLAHEAEGLLRLPCLSRVRRLNIGQ